MFYLPFGISRDPKAREWDKEGKYGARNRRGCRPSTEFVEPPS